jgi:hypothetical protein
VQAERRGENKLIMKQISHDRLKMVPDYPWVIPCQFMGRTTPLGLNNQI